MIDFIKTLIGLYKIIKFVDDKLVISYNGSQIILNNNGDIYLNAKRNLVHNYRYMFQGCDAEYVEELTKAAEKGEIEKAVEKHIDREILKENAQCQI